MTQGGYQVIIILPIKGKMAAANAAVKDHLEPPLLKSSPLFTF